MFEAIRRSSPRSWLLPAVLSALAACASDLTLPPAQLPIAQHIVNLSAVTGTPVNTPSGYNMIALVEIRTEQTSDFDFLFDIGPDSSYGLGTTGDTIAVLLPRGALGFQADGGIQWTLMHMDSIRLAPLDGYETRKATRVRSGDVVIAASRLRQCEFGILSPRYAKMEIVSIIQRVAQIRIIIDPNCGYRQLTSGIPVR